MTIDQLDRNLLSELATNGRASMQQLSQSTGLSRSAVFNRVKRLEKEGVITGYHAHVDRQKLGIQIRAFCNVSLQKHEAGYLQQFEKAIGSFEEVKTCFHIAGAFDYLLEVHAHNMNDYHVFISRRLAALDNIGKVESMFVMREVLESRELTPPVNP